MSNQKKKEERRKARELEQQQREQKEARNNKIKKVLIAIIAIAGVAIFFARREYIGYFLTAVAVPYGVYGLFAPYKSAREFAKKGCDRLYSSQFGALMISLGVLGFLYSRMFSELDQNKWFLVAMLVYLVFFFIVLSLLQKRYMKAPTVDEDTPTLEEMANMVRAAKKESKENKKNNKETNTEHNQENNNL